MHRQTTPGRQAVDAVPETVETTEMSPEAVDTGIRWRMRWLDFLPAVVSAGVVVRGLLLTHTPPAAIGRYVLYLVFALLVPGTLVHRALRGHNPLLIVDLALGAATGIVLELLAWAIFVSLGIGQFLWLWPLAVIVPFVAVPALRQHWRVGGHTERMPVTAWLIAGVLSLYTLAVVVVYMRAQALPPNANAYYIDVYWHMANAAELSRQVPQRCRRWPAAPFVTTGSPAPTWPRRT
jgi:hypothetical protein